MEIVTILLWLIVLVAVCWVAFWLIDQIGIGPPINMLLKAVVAIIGLVVLLERTGVLAGVHI